MATKKKVKNGAELLKLFKEYSEHAKANPKKVEVYNQKLDKVITLNKEVPLTQVGFSNYCGFYTRYYLREDGYNYNNNPELGFKEASDQIKASINADQTEGSMAGIYHHGIAGSLLALKQHVEVKEEKTITIDFT